MHHHPPQRRRDEAAVLRAIYASADVQPTHDAATEPTPAAATTPAARTTSYDTDVLMQGIGDILAALRTLTETLEASVCVAARARARASTGSPAFAAHPLREQWPSRAVTEPPHRR